MRLVLLTILLACLLAPGARAQAPVPPDDPLLAPPGRCAGDADPAAHHRAQRLAMHCLIAEVRRRAGLPRLRSSTSLRHSATYKARRIAACRVFTHAPCGDELGRPFVQARLTRAGRWRVGEDLAWGVGPGSTARVALNRWLHSPSHRDVLLTGAFSHLGLRRRRLQMQGAPAGAVLWVAHLGRPAGR